MREENKDTAEKLDTKLETRIEIPKDREHKEQDREREERDGLMGQFGHLAFLVCPLMASLLCTPPPSCLAHKTRATLMSPGWHQEW